MSQDSANDDPPKETAAGVDVAANAAVDVLDLSTIIDQNPPLINFAIGGDGCDEGQTSKKEMRLDGGGGAKETGGGDEKKPSTSSVEEEPSIMDVAKTSVKDAYLPERSSDVELEEDAPTHKKRGRGRPPGSKNRSAAAGPSLAVNADQKVQVGAGKSTSTGTAAAVPQKKSADPTAMNVDPSVRKSQRARTPAPKPAAAKQDGKSTSNAARKKAGEAQELYRQIKTSRDKLFFIAYSHHQDPAVDKGKQSGKAKEQWYLVRVDLATCRELDSTKDCQKTGIYYVEFYTKASYDQGILLLGNPMENNVRAADMKPRLDSESRYWAEWHEYHYDKKGDMIVGKAKEINPNSKRAIQRRLLDLTQPNRTGPSSPGSTCSEGEERLVWEYHPDFDKVTVWADEINLLDTETRLVGPFNFDDVKAPPLKEDNLKSLNTEARKLFASNPSDFFVKERVHLSHWEELSSSLKGRDVGPPTLSVKKKRKKKTTAAGSKRPHEEKSKGQPAQPSGAKKARETPAGTNGRSSEKAKESVCEVCGKGAIKSQALLLFPGTSSRRSFRAHISCAKKNGQPVVRESAAKEKLLSIVESALSQSRKATTHGGDSYYVLGELQEALGQSLGGLFGKRAEVRAPAPPKKRVAQSSPAMVEPLILEAMPVSEFTDEEIESFPVAFAYQGDDHISEENAKIATLDYEVEQRRLKRNANKAKGTPKAKSGVVKPASASKRELGVDPAPAEGFPEGWTTRTVPRVNAASAKTSDTFWYSPKLGLKFRSRPEVRKFLSALESTGGDETLAIKKVGEGG